MQTTQFKATKLSSDLRAARTLKLYLSDKDEAKDRRRFAANSAKSASA